MKGVMSRAFSAAAVPAPTSGGRLSVSRSGCQGVRRRVRSLLGVGSRGRDQERCHRCCHRCCDRRCDRRLLAQARVLLESPQSRTIGNVPIRTEEHRRLCVAMRHGFGFISLTVAWPRACRASAVRHELARLPRSRSCGTRQSTPCGEACSRRATPQATWSRRREPGAAVLSPICPTSAWTVPLRAH